MAQYLDKDPFTYEHEKRTFMNDLRQFHISKGTPLNRLPCIGGKELDLYLLYNKVVSLGGFTKVSDQELWESLLEFFGLPAFCGQGGYALRKIYTRCLVAYEKINHGGEDADEVLRGEGGRTTISYSTAQKFSYGRCVPDNVRITTCMETTLIKQTDYDKLRLSLECGLPNEVDFALNVCTLLSNESKHVLHLEQEPRLLDLLLAHVGIFLEGAGSYRNVYHDSWKTYTDRNFVKYWYDTVQDKEIREVIGPDSKKPKDINKFSDSLLFAQRNEGIKDVERSRILQVGIILRNLSFEKHNQHVMARHRTLYRFLLLCSHNDCSTLKHIGMDTLSNIAELFNLDPIDYRSSQLMFHTIYKGLYDKDKYVMLRAMDIVEKLCKTVGNSEILIECLEQRLYDRVVAVLTIHDIQLLLGALELLLILSEKGEVTCTHIVESDRSIDVLVCLVTLDAQSLGQDAFIGIKIVDHAPDGIHHPIVTINQQGSMAQVRAPMPTAPMNPQLQQQVMPQTGVNRVQTTPVQRPLPMVHLARSSPLQRPSSQNTISAVSGTPLRPTPPNPDPDNESFACQWLNATYEANVNGKVARTDLYASYLSSCSKASQKAILSSTHFGRCLKAVFPGVHYQRTETHDGPQYHILGVNKRAIQLPLTPSLPQAFQGAAQRSNFVPQVPHGSPPPRYPVSPQVQRTPQQVQYYTSPQVTPGTPQPRIRQLITTNMVYTPGQQSPLQMGQQRQVVVQQGNGQSQTMVIRQQQHGMNHQGVMVQQPGVSVNQGGMIQQPRMVQSQGAFVQQSGAAPNQNIMVQQTSVAQHQGVIVQQSGVPTNQSTMVQQSGVVPNQTVMVQQPSVAVNHAQPTIMIHLGSQQTAPQQANQPGNTQQPGVPTTSTGAPQTCLNQVVLSRPQQSIQTQMALSSPSVPPQESPSQPNPPSLPKPPNQPGTTPTTPTTNNPAPESKLTPQKPVGGSPKKPGTISGVGTPHKAQAPEHPPLENGEVQIERVPNIHVQHIPSGGNIQLGNAPEKIVMQDSGVVTVNSQQMSGVSSALHQALVGNQPGEQVGQQQSNIQHPPVQQNSTQAQNAVQQVKTVPVQSNIQGQQFVQNIQQQFVGQISHHQAILPKTTFVQTSQSLNQSTIVARPMVSPQGSQPVQIQNQLIYQRPIAPSQSSRYQAIAPKRPNSSTSPKPADSPLIKKLLKAGSGLKAYVSNPNLLNQQQVQQLQGQNQMVLQQIPGQQPILVNQQVILPNQQFIQQQQPMMQNQSVVQNQQPMIVNQVNQQPVMHNQQQPMIQNQQQSMLQNQQLVMQNQQQNQLQPVSTSAGAVILNKQPPTIMLSQQPQIVLTRPPPSSPHAVQIQMHPKPIQPKPDKQSPILEDQEKKIELIKNEGYRTGESIVEKMEVDSPRNVNGDVKMNRQESEELDSDNDDDLINGNDNRSVSTNDSGINGNDDEKIDHLIQNGPTKLSDDILPASEKIEKILKKGAKGLAINALSKENLLNGYRPDVGVELTVQRVEKPKTNGNPPKSLDDLALAAAECQSVENNKSKPKEKILLNGIPNGGVASPHSESSMDIDISSNTNTNVLNENNERTLSKSINDCNSIPITACESPSDTARNTETNSEQKEVKNVPISSSSSPLQAENSSNDSQPQTQGSNHQPVALKKSKLLLADNGQIDGKGLKRLLEASHIPANTIPCKVGISSAAERRRRRSSSSSTSSKKSSSRKSSMPGVGLYLCEWKGCKKSYNKAKSLWVHASKEHVTSDVYRGICEWNGCDRVKRQVWSCVSHLQDKHCTEVALAAASAKRTEQMLRQQSTPPSHASSPSPQPQSVPQAPVIYNAHNAYHAIRRSLHVPALKDLLGESEGPVTKSIRITAALILKNIAKYSPEGRRMLRHHEFHLARIVISQAESSSTLAKCLEEMQKDS
ncbi:uncharacterized protein [Antedon mediterranea]|uniref:uncharacterized protein n=1 Tax=Antedon mediterranea TaxID=105859 RepID=UPI003AF5D229